MNVKGLVRSWRGGGSMSAKGDVRLKFSMNMMPAKEKSVPCPPIVYVSARRSGRNFIGYLTYASDPDMNPSIVNKPVHKGPLWRHHMRVPFGLLLLLLLRCESWPIIPRLSGRTSRGMRWWSKFVRLWENIFILFRRGLVGNTAT